MDSCFYVWVNFVLIVFPILIGYFLNLIRPNLLFYISFLFVYCFLHKYSRGEYLSSCYMQWTVLSGMREKHKQFLAEVLYLEASGPGDDLNGMVEYVVIGKWFFSFCSKFFAAIWISSYHWTVLMNRV